MPPQPLLDQRLRHRGLIVRPQEYGILAKTGECDESILFDAPDLHWLGRILQVLRSQPAGQPVWPFDLQQQNHHISTLSNMLQLELLKIEAYSLRHGGASHDALLRRRSLAEIKERGRWRTDSSMLRYKKATRALQRLQLIPASTQEYGGHIELNLERFFLSGAAPPPPASHAKLLRP